jgi:magnesium-transporting ATPase (P-type)
MKQLKQYIISGVLAFVALFGLAAVPTASVLAVNPADKVGDGVTAAGGSGQQLEPQIQQVINVLLFIIGVISVIMIILGGIRYVLSNGDSAQITSAKNTVLYSVIGLVVALLGYAIVNFVVAQFAA